MKYAVLLSALFVAGLFSAEKKSQNLFVHNQLVQPVYIGYINNDQSSDTSSLDYRSVFPGVSKSLKGTAKNPEFIELCLGYASIGSCQVKTRISNSCKVITIKRDDKNRIQIMEDGQEIVSIPY